MATSAAGGPTPGWSPALASATSACGSAPPARRARTASPPALPEGARPAPSPAAAHSRAGRAGSPARSGSPRPQALQSPPMERYPEARGHRRRQLGSREIGLGPHELQNVRSHLERTPAASLVVEQPLDALFLEGLGHQVEGGS